MKQIAEIDKDVLPDADIAVFFEVNKESWLNSLKSRNRSTDNDEEFLKNFETQNFLLEATKKLCEEKGIELIIFSRGASSLEDSAARIRNLLENKLVNKN
jgi:hypothetical protein